MSIRVIVNGATGRMGRTTVEAIKHDPELELVAGLNSNDDLQQVIQDTNAHVVVDFTLASVAYDNLVKIIEAGAHPVVGTSGFLPEQIADLQSRCAEKQLGGVIAPNFSISAVLMMKYAADAVKYHPDVEIIEMHHDGKQDAPSGTAIKTASLLAEHRDPNYQSKPATEMLAGSRGALHQGIPIHAIRMPGVVANQQVIFGGQGETLTISHNTINRECFMPGVLLACKKVLKLNELVYGLEHLL